MGYKIENIHKDLIIYTNGVPSVKEFHRQKFNSLRECRYSLMLHPKMYIHAQTQPQYGWFYMWYAPKMPSFINFMRKYMCDMDAGGYLLYSLLWPLVSATTSIIHSLLIQNQLCIRAQSPKNEALRRAWVSNVEPNLVHWMMPQSNWSFIVENLNYKHQVFTANQIITKQIANHN